MDNVPHDDDAASVCSESAVSVLTAASSHSSLTRVSKRNPNKRAYRKHLTYYSMEDDLPNYELFDGVMLYDGTSPLIKEKYEREIAILRRKLGTEGRTASLAETKLVPEGRTEFIFSGLEHSTTTADGQIANIAFDERVLIKELPVPNGRIVRIGCNFGELYNPYITVEAPKKKTNKGRKPKAAATKKEKKTKRKIQGTGAYFNTQITFNVLPADYSGLVGDGNTRPIVIPIGETYDVKLFRNGKFQMSGVQDPTMRTIVPVLQEVCRFLNASRANNSLGTSANLLANQTVSTISPSENKLGTECRTALSTTTKPVPEGHTISPSENKLVPQERTAPQGHAISPYAIRSVMRNYKTHLTNPKMRVKLRELEHAINLEKKSTNHYDNVSNFINNNLNKVFARKLLPYIAKRHPMGIAEVRYNNDKIMSLIVKLYRPIPDDMEKKHTINVYVSGKVNFDGGNSELEVMHIYYWLEYIFQKYESALLIHVDAIHHFVPQDDDNTDSESIYDDEIIYTDPTSDIYTKRVAAVVTRT